MTATDMRSLSPAAKHARRVRVIELRAAGTSYVRIAELTGLSRTGAFDICARHEAIGAVALRDAPNGRRAGDGRRLTPGQEALLCELIASHTPDQLMLPQPLWTRGAVGELIEQRLGLQMPVRTLAAYLVRWDFAAVRPMAAGPGSVPSAVQRWLADEYPGIAAQSSAQDGEIGWGGRHALAGDRPLSMISSLSNKRHLRWQTVADVLQASALIDFMRRLIQGTSRRLFLIMDGLRVSDDRAVEHWLLLHEEAIQVFHLPEATAWRRIGAAAAG